MNKENFTGIFYTLRNICFPSHRPDWTAETQICLCSYAPSHPATQACLSGLFSCPVFGVYSWSCSGDPGQSCVRLPFCLRTCLWFLPSLRVPPSLIYGEGTPGSVSAEPSTREKSKNKKSLLLRKIRPSESTLITAALQCKTILPRINLENNPSSQRIINVPYLFKTSTHTSAVFHPNTHKASVRSCPVHAGSVWDVGLLEAVLQHGPSSLFKRLPANNIQTHLIANQM